MNCDLVFEILTRGPFPTGEPTDASVELHLASCYECRQLAEALRPATSLIHEALEHDTDDLPGYRGELPAIETQSGGVAAAVEAAIAEIARETTGQHEQLPVEVIVRNKPVREPRRLALLPLSLAMLAVAILVACVVGLPVGDMAEGQAGTLVGGESSSEHNWSTVMAGLPASCQIDLAQNPTVTPAIERTSVSLLSRCCQCHVGQVDHSRSLALADHSAGLCLACHTN